MRIMLLAMALMLSGCVTINAPADAAPPIEQATSSSPLTQRADQIPAVLKGNIAPEEYFDSSFLAAVPAEQFKAVSESLIAQYGQPLEVLNVLQKSPTRGVVTLAFEKAVATINISITGAAQNKVNGLLAASFAAKDDSFEKIKSDFAALPGSAGFVAEKLNEDGTIRPVSGYNAGTQFAIGSTFKLYILAELGAQIQAKERAWSDVVPLANRSFSSKATNGWPKDAPVTLMTLALQMIAVSDNSASDTLLLTLGRTAVERKLAQIGHSDPNKILPFLSTVEAFALKSPANNELRTRFLGANEAKQRQIVDTEKAKLGLDQVDDQAFANGPAFIGAIEWFASPDDLANLLNHIRLTRNDRMLEIMAVNPGISPTDAAKWNYVGYKGGSEPGVISMSFLLHSKSGQWYAISGSWNDPAKAVDERKFTALMTRLVQAAE
jgi:beta-lactamase class A